MEHLNIESSAYAYEKTRQYPDYQDIYGMTRRSAVLSRIFKRALTGLGNTMVEWGSRLQQHQETLITTSTEGNPTPC